MFCLFILYFSEASISEFKRQIFCIRRCKQLRRHTIASGGAGICNCGHTMDRNVRKMWKVTMTFCNLHILTLSGISSTYFWLLLIILLLLLLFTIYNSVKTFETIFLWELRINSKLNKRMRGMCQRLLGANAYPTFKAPSLHLRLSRNKKPSPPSIPVIIAAGTSSS